MGCSHDPANVQQTSTKCIQNTRANAGRLLDHVSTLLDVLSVGVHVLLDPIDIRWHTRSNAQIVVLTTSAVRGKKAVDSNNSPRVFVIFARQRTSAVTLQLCHYVYVSTIEGALYDVR